MATFAVFVAAMKDLHVNGVQRHYERPPAQVGTADLPAGFPLMPAGELGELALSCLATNKNRSMTYVIAVEAAGQGTIGQNYDELPGLMDNLETALDALAEHQGGTLATWIDYTITTTSQFPIGGNEYWAIIANVTARDTA